MTPDFAHFFEYATAREAIRLRKEAGSPPPWTDDPVLRSVYFCNVFREDDRVTRWFRENVRGPLAEDPRVVLATIIFRWFNYIPTGEKILDVLLDPELIRQGPTALKQRLHDRLRPDFDAGEQLITGAFMVNSPYGKDKLNGLLWCIGEAWSLLSRIYDARASLQEAHAAIMEIPHQGAFSAYEVVTDLRWTYLLRNAPDINSWASAGPGAARGLRWIYGGDLLPYGSRAGQEAMLAKMRDLLEASRFLAFWPADWPRWEMREVEHTLCEYDKYKRGQTGGRLKRMYKGGGA